jgi:hypothetical protein
MSKEKVNAIQYDNDDAMEITAEDLAAAAKTQTVGEIGIRDHRNNNPQDGGIIPLSIRKKYRPLYPTVKGLWRHGWTPRQAIEKVNRSKELEHRKLNPKASDTNITYWHFPITGIVGDIEATKQRFHEANAPGSTSQNLERLAETSFHLIQYVAQFGIDIRGITSLEIGN